MERIRLSHDQVFLSAADQTIIFSSYGNIGSDLRALNKTPWIATRWVIDSLIPGTYLILGPAISLL